MTNLSNVLRYLVGLLFIVSGLIKQNDPLGFSYKLEEYFQVLNIAFLDPLALTIAITMCALEIILGFAIIVRYKTKASLYALVALTIAFSFLTFYSAYFDVVKTCGCFGDALVLKPWESFIKDIVILLFLIIIIIGDKDEKIYYRHLNTIMAFIVSFSFGLGIYVINSLPIIDFLPYKVGQNLPALNILPEGAKPDEFRVYYTLENKNTKETKVIDDIEYLSSKIYADTTWKFISGSEPVLVKPGYQFPIKDFKVFSEEGNDITEEVINNPKFSIWIVKYHLNNRNLEARKKLNQLVEWAKRSNVNIIGLTATDKATAHAFKNETGALYDFFYVDAVPLKTLVRANTGIVLIKDGTILGKWNLKQLPSTSDLTNNYILNPKYNK